MTDTKIKTTTAAALAPGYIVGLRLRPETAPLRCYIGEVQAVDEHGVRVTLIDWLLGLFCGHDLYVPWANIEASYVATEDDKLANGDLERWQRKLGEEVEDSPSPPPPTLDDFLAGHTMDDKEASAFFKGHPMGSWLQMRIERDIVSADVRQQRDANGVKQFFKTEGVPDPKKPKLVLGLPVEVLASSDPVCSSGEWPDRKTVLWLKGLTRDALVAAIGAAGVEDAETVFRKGKLGGSVITMISAGEKPPNNPMFSATKLYNFTYQPLREAK